MFLSPFNRVKSAAKASVAAADELNMDVFEGGCQQHRAKYVFWTALELFWMIVFMRLPH